MDVTKGNGAAAAAPDERGRVDAVPSTAAAPAARRRPRAKPKPKCVRWSAKREETFLATLAQTSNVAASIRASGLSESNVYRHRQQSDEFRARWAGALREGFVKLETMLLDRALNGQKKTVWHGGKRVGTMIEYSDRLALALLNAHRTSVTGVRTRAAEEAPATDDDLRTQLLERLGGMNQRMGGEG